MASGVSQANKKWQRPFPPLFRLVSFLVCSSDSGPMLTLFRLGRGSKFNRRGKPQVLVHVSTNQGNPFWNSGWVPFWISGFLTVTHIGAEARNLLFQWCVPVFGSTRLIGAWVRLTCVTSALSNAPTESNEWRFQRFWFLTELSIVSPPLPSPCPPPPAFPLPRPWPCLGFGFWRRRSRLGPRLAPAAARRPSPSWRRRIGRSPWSC